MSGGRARTLALALAGCLPALALYRPSSPPSFLGGTELGFFGLPGIRQADHWQVRERLRPSAERPYWRPLESVALLGLNRIAGDRPGPLLLAKALLHGLVAVLLGTLARRVAGEPRVGLAAAALFAAHPVATQGAAWLVSFNEQFVALAILGTVLLFLRGLSGDSPLSRVGALLSCGAGILFKEVAVVAPLLAIGAGLAARAGDLRRLLQAAAPMLGVVAAYLLVRTLALSAGPEGASAVIPDGSVRGAALDLLVRPWGAFLLPMGRDALGPWPPLVRAIPAVVLLGSGVLALLHGRPAVRLAVFAAAMVPVATGPAIGRLLGPTGDWNLWRLYFPAAGLALVQAALLVPVGAANRRALWGAAPALAVALLGLSTEASAGAWREARETFSRFHEELRLARPPGLEGGKILLLLEGAPAVVRGVKTGVHDPLSCAVAWSLPLVPGEDDRRGGRLRVLGYAEPRAVDPAGMTRAFGPDLRWFAFRWDPGRRRLEPLGSGRTG